VMALAALIEDRRGQAAGWGGIAALAVGFLAWHATQVTAVALPNDIASAGWAGFGGLAFSLKAHWHTGGFRAVPASIAAVAIPLAWLGWTGWRGTAGLRGGLVVCGYAAGLMVAGRDDNFYWAFLTAPLVPLGLLFAPQALSDLASRASTRHLL
jgi:hypothetical protein